MEEVLLFLFLVHVKSQPLPVDSVQVKPDKCNPGAEFLYRQCCVFPPFFVRDIAKACGSLYEITFVDRKNDVTGLRRTANSRCDYWKCLLGRYGLVNRDNETLSDVLYFKHLDKWVQYNPDFESVMMKAKNYCKDNYRLLFPLNLCDFSSFQGCIRHFVNVDCPVTLNTKECYEQKRFYDQCREFYF